jgi:hypothetical protein
MILVRAESASKRYRIGERERYVALRRVLSRALHAPARMFRRTGTGILPVNGNGNHNGRIWVLRDVRQQWWASSAAMARAKALY